MTQGATQVVTDPANALLTRLEGRSPAMDIAADIARRAVFAAPLVVAFGAIWGWSGVASAAYGLVVVVVNFLLAGWLLAVTGRISFAAMAGAAMFGYLLRLGVVSAAVLLVRDAGWVEIVPLAVTLIVTHLGLLLWELRYISGSFAYPGLKPSVARSASPPASPPANPSSAEA
jgi:hypothetical protein